MFDNQDRKYQERAERGEKPSPGPSGKSRHRVRIDVYERQKTREHGEIPKVTVRIVEGAIDPVGAERSVAWWINEAGLSGEYEYGDALAFGRAVYESLGGDPANTPKVRELLTKMLDATQPARGVDLWCDSVGKTSKRGNAVINCSFEAIPHTAEQIKAQRAQLEEWKAGKVPAAAVQQPVTAPVGGAVATPPAGFPQQQEVAPAAQVTAPVEAPKASGSLLDGLLP